MTAATLCSLVHVAYAHSTNIDPSAAGAFSGNFSQPTSCLGTPEAADALLADSSLYCAVGLNGWAAFRFLVRQLAPGHLDGDGDGSKEVIPSNSEVWQHSWPMWRVPGPATCLLSDPGAPPLPHTTQHKPQVLLKQRWLVVLISILVMACVLGAEALARARDARKPDDGRNRCAQKRASAASPRQKTPLPQLGCATTQLRPRKMARGMHSMLRLALLCHLSVAVEGADRAATNLVCLTDEPGQVYLSFAGASATAFPEEIPQADALSVAQARPCCTTTWAGRVKTTANLRL